MNSKKGFTLIELLAVIVILAILVLLAMPAVTSIMESSARNTFKNEILGIVKTMENAYTEKWGNGDIVSDFTNDTNIHTVTKDDKTYSYLCMSLQQLYEEQYIKKNLGTNYSGYIQMYVGEDETFTNINTTNGTYYMQGEYSALSASTYEPTKTNNGKEVTACPGDKNDLDTPSTGGETPTEDESVTGATFKDGVLVNAKMKGLAQGSTTDGLSDRTDTAIKAFTRSTTLPSQYATEDYIVSIDDSPIPIYMWFDNETIYWYSEATKVYLNEDSTLMFYYLLNIETIDLSDLNTSKVTNMKRMFSNCMALTSLDVSNFETSNVTDMAGMFRLNNSLTELDVSGFKTSNVTDMSAMFYLCTNLTSLDVSGFKTNNVTNMSLMFSNCIKLTNLDVSKWNTEKVTNMAGMFTNCEKITRLNISNFDTRSLVNISSAKNFTYDGSIINNYTEGGMFEGMQSLVELNLGSKFNTSNVTNMAGLFMGDKNLTILDLSTFDTSKVENMLAMFYRCEKLETIYVGNNWNTSKITNQNIKTYENNKEVSTSVDGGWFMFKNDSKLVGGATTTYNSSYVDKTYAHVDGGPSNPGYLTLKTI